MLIYNLHNDAHLSEYFDRGRGLYPVPTKICQKTVANLHSKILNAPPSQFFFIFMQFSAKFSQIIDCQLGTPLGDAPWETLICSLIERNNSYYFSRANQQKAGTKIYSLTQCNLTVNECDWHISAGNDERINSHCLIRYLIFLGPTSTHYLPSTI